MEWYHFTISGLILSMLGSIIMQFQFNIGSVMSILGIVLCFIGVLKTFI